MLLLTLCLAVLPRAALAWTDLGGGDHFGADWEPANGSVIAGVHTNIGTFRVVAGRTITVRAYDGLSYGSVEIHACTIDVQGTLSADAAGQRGARAAAAQGGLQGGGSGGGCGGGPGSCVGNGGAGGGYGGLGGQTDPNNAWDGPCDRCNNPTVAHCQGAAGATYGTSNGTDVAMGSGGGSGGNG